MKLKIVILFVLIAFCGKTHAQEILTVEDAIKIALQNNYDIRISSNDLKIDQQNVSLANAGMLPRVDASVTDNHGLQDISQTRNDGTRSAVAGGKSENLNYGVNLGWTVFDGFRMFARYDQLKQLEKLGDAELKLTILNKIGDVMNTYYDLVQQQQQLAALDSTIVISKQRVDLSQNRFTIGKAAKLEVLNAQVDLNTDQTNFLRQQETYANTKTLLNEILARDVATDFRVVDDITVDNSLLLPDLTTLAEKQNPELEAQVINRRIAELNLKQVRAARYPTVNLNTGYNWAETKSSLGFTSESYSKGLTYGIGANINVFNGFLQKRNERIAKLQIDNSKLAVEQQTLALHSQLTSAYQTYLTNIRLIELETNNERIAKQNLDITLEKYRIGTINTLEYRTAQLNYLNAIVRYNNARYQAKLSEIQLKELAGNLTF
ncbi:MAG: TolC family protein [Flavobacterium sp.]|nr:MAG: TolC family protein [Flavobacterium sp.]